MATLQFCAAVKRKEALYSDLCSICDFLNSLTAITTFYIFCLRPQSFLIFSIHPDYYGETCSPHITLNFQSQQPVQYPEPTADTFPCTHLSFGSVSCPRSVHPCMLYFVHTFNLSPRSKMLNYKHKIRNGTEMKKNGNGVIFINFTLNPE
jgi:hypothetical protein